MLFTVAAIEADNSDDKKTPSAISPQHSFSQTSPLPGATVAHSATVLADGTILVVGGFGQLFGRIPLAVNLARIYDPATDTWKMAKGHLNHGRFHHGAILCQNGKVMIAGGRGQDTKAMRSIELYDPRTQQFQVIAQMARPRRRPQLINLPSSSVLITGGNRLAEICNPDTTAETGYSVHQLNNRCLFHHRGHVALTLHNATILLLGGMNRHIERYDPTTETFKPCKATLPALYDDQAGALLHDGRVLLAGGQNIITGKCTNRTWIYDPKKDNLIEGPQLQPYDEKGIIQPGASDIMAVDLFADDPVNQGRYILLCGGEYDPGRKGADVVLSSAWVFDADCQKLIDVGPMQNPHDDFAAVALSGSNNIGRALIIAGHGTDDSFQSKCEIFTWPIDDQLPNTP